MPNRLSLGALLWPTTLCVTRCDRGGDCSDFSYNTSEISDVPLLDERAGHVCHVSFIHCGPECFGPGRITGKQSVNVERKPLASQKDTLPQSRRLRERRYMLNASRKRHLRPKNRQVQLDWMKKSGNLYLHASHYNDILSDGAPRKLTEYLLRGVRVVALPNRKSSRYNMRCRYNLPIRNESESRTFADFFVA